MSHPEASSTDPLLEPLLVPIPGEDPCGESLRYEPLYDAVREARRADDPALPQGTWKTALKKADWSEVRRLCSQALAERSKDLQLAVWLTEAWIHLDGFPGARRGFELQRRLVETFWEGLYPRIEDDDPAYRLAPLEWADDKLDLALAGVPLTDRQDDGRRLTHADWAQALYRDNLDRRKGEAGEKEEGAGAGHLTAEGFLHAAGLSAPGRFRDHLIALLGVREALTALVAALEERCGDGAPRLGRLIECVDEQVRLARRVLGPEAEAIDARLAVGADEAAGAAADQDGADQDGAGPTDSPPGDEPMAEAAADPSHPAGSGPVTSRAEAYRRLEEAAEFLLRTEPHSPVPYLVKRAVSWGGLSLADLLKELSVGGSDLEAVYRLLGIGDERH